MKEQKSYSIFSDYNIILEINKSIFKKFSSFWELNNVTLNNYMLKWKLPGKLENISD